MNSFAKINLGLQVLEKRKDGFHNLETIFLKIGWADEIRFKPAENITLICYEKDLPTDERNLCMKAALRLATFAERPVGVQMYLAKNIPHGAGLGGGSGNAATVLKYLNTFWELNLSEDKLQAIGAELGADVPFFLKDKPQYATGKGEILTDFNYEFPFYLVVVKPKCSVATAQAFAQIQPNANHRADIRSVVASNDLALWSKELVNDFEASVLPQFPEIQRFKTEFEHFDAQYVAMSGSGSAVFGVFTHKEAAEKIYLLHAIRGYEVWCNFRRTYAHTMG